MNIGEQRKMLTFEPLDVESQPFDKTAEVVPVDDPAVNATEDAELIEVPI